MYGQGRRWGCLVWVFGMCLVILRCGASSIPNVVMILADDMGWGDTSLNGGVARTPNLDEMALGANSVNFLRFYSGGPVCSPTRATILTGRNHNRECIYAANAGVNSPDFAIPEKMALPTSIFTIGKAFQKKEILTAHFGKWHLGDFKKLDGGNKKWPVSHPGLNGFDIWYSTERSAASETLNCGCFLPIKDCITGHYNVPSFACNNYWMPNASFPNGITNETQKETGNDAEHLVDVFQDFLEKHAQSGPFLAVLWLHAVHVPFVASDYWRNQYAGHNRSSAQLDYYGALTAMDEQVGRVRKLLKQYNISENTMLWFLSDNGPEGNAPPNGNDVWPGSTNGLRGRKRAVYEGGIRVPGILEWPNRIAKNYQVKDYPVVTLDFLPTIMELLNVSSETSWPIDGHSLIPLINNITANKQGPFIRNYPIGFEYRFNTSQWHAAWLDNEWKLYCEIIHKPVPFGQLGTCQLYNLVQDPHETTDVSSKNQQRVTVMKKQLTIWRQSVGNSQLNETQCFGTDGFYL